jgi:hypothetical protein
MSTRLYNSCTSFVLKFAVQYNYTVYYLNTLLKLIFARNVSSVFRYNKANPALVLHLFALNPLANLHHFFSVAPHFRFKSFGRLCSVTLNIYFRWEYHFLFTLLWLTLTFPGEKQWHKRRSGLLILLFLNEFIDSLKYCIKYVRYLIDVYPCNATDAHISKAILFYPDLY